MAATSSALAAGLAITIPARPIRNARKTANDLRPLRDLVAFNFPLLRHGIVCHQPHLNRTVFSGITGGGHQLTRRAPIGQFGEIIAFFPQYSFGGDGAEGTEVATSWLTNQDPSGTAPFRPLPRRTPPRCCSPAASSCRSPDSSNGRSSPWFRAPRLPTGFSRSSCSRRR